MSCFEAYFREMTGLDHVVLGPLNGLFDSWFAIDTMAGEDRGLAARQQFADWRREHRGMFPPMIETPVAKEWAEHPAVHDRGSAYLYGGVDRRFETSCHLNRPLLIGKGTLIGTSAKVYGPCIIGENNLLAGSSQVIRCYTRDKVEIDHLAFVAWAKIGSGVYIGPGARLLYKEGRGDKEVKTFDYRDGGRLGAVDTHLRRCGPVIGDGSEICADAILLPGTILPPDSYIPIRAIVGGIHDKHSLERYLKTQGY